jgi:inner membrane protein
VEPITQGLIGAAAAQCGARPERLRIAALAGVIGGLLPDVDVLIRSPTDPLLFLDYHRHFTHSLFFIPIGAVIAASLTRLLTRRRETVRALFWPCLLGVATHGLLDSCTSYGTRLLWPLSDARVAWHVIGIIDPLFTLGLLVGVTWATIKRRRRAVIIGAALSMAYMGLCVVQHQRALGVQAALIAARGHEGLEPQVKPSIGNNILYRAFYTHDGRYYVDAIRVPWWGEPRVYTGGDAPALDLPAYVARNALDALRRSDIARFSDFSAGHLIEDPQHCGVLSDFRYAAVPDEIAPLWGIDVLGTPVGAHLNFHRFSGVSPRQRAHFYDMLLGR